MSTGPRASNTGGTVGKGWISPAPKVRGNAKGETWELLNDPGGVRFAAAHCLRRLPWFLTHSPLSCFCPVARDSKLQDHRVVHHPVNGRRRGHRVLEDLVPLREHQVTGDHHAPAFVALGEEGEEHLHLGAVLLLLLERVQTRNRDEISFVVGILGAYTGQTFLQDLCREIVAVLSADDQLLILIEIVLDSMGATTGEFGHVAGLKRKRMEIEAWLQDPRDRVGTFAETHLRSLDRQIAAEQRRGVEAMELRKREYESTSDDAE